MEAPVARLLLRIAFTSLTIIAGATCCLAFGGADSSKFDGPAELPRVYVKSALSDTPAPGKSMLVKDAVFTLNILEAAQTDMIAHFGKGFALADDAFVGLDIQRAVPHGPILQEAHAYLHAKVVSTIAAGDHDLFLAEVTAGCQLDDGQPMVHIRKNGFHY